MIKLLRLASNFGPPHLSLLCGCSYRHVPPYPVLGWFVIERWFSLSLCCSEVAVLGVVQGLQGLA